MTSHDFSSLGPHGFHRIAYTEWNAESGAARRLAVCVHGLVRNGRDFDRLAQALLPDYRVICPDMAGRGRSEWLPVAGDYGYPLYLADCAALLARLGAEEVDWIGTSMGGILGMLLAAQPNTPIRRLVINDIGPSVPKAAIKRIGDYIGADPHFASLAAFEKHLRVMNASWGALDDDQWRDMAASFSRPLPDGGYGFAYDPAIAQSFKASPPADVDLWPVWQAIKCPVLVLHGTLSDLLLPDTVAEMKARAGKQGPMVEVVDIPGCGHAPSLMVPDQIKLIAEWLGGC